MSRRPTTTRPPGGLSRAVSSASIAMPPPRQIPVRPPSVNASTSSNRNQEQSDSRPSSPRKSSVVRRTGLTSNKSKEAENGEINIQVVVRCRGRSPQELATTSPIITTTTGPLGKAITVETTPMASSSLSSFTTASSYGGTNAPSTKTYPFDKVFGPEADQSMVFDEVAEGMLDEVLAGYNCTIFAYGQTGTGKTYTMQGDLELSPLSSPTDSAGIVPRVLHRLFALLNAAENTEFAVKCSYVELYNEELRDLLSSEPSTSATTNNQGGGGLKLYEDGKKGTMIQGLEEVGVKTLREALAVVNRGCQKRQVAETKMNTESSRSHTILSITVHVKEMGVASGGEDLLKVGKFNLVDLAGSEAIGRSGATDKRAREAGMINQSLLTLGRVISALVEKGPHIPYRESKLTRLLQDSLGGKTKTCIVATVSPTRSNMEETLSTLDYAIRAKSILNRPELNQHLTKTGLLKEYLSDIEKLKAEVLAAREKNGIYIPEEQWREMQEDLAKQKSDYDEAKLRASSATVELATKKKAFDELCSRMLATTEELKEAREAERQLGALLDQIKEELEVNRQRLEEEIIVAQAYEAGEARLDGIAMGLRNVAQESVSDVGGLFEKLARKASVLGNNSDATTRFGADLQGLSQDLRKGLAKMKSAHGEMGKQLEAEMTNHAKKGEQISQRDIAALEAAFGSFSTLVSTMSEHIATGQAESSSQAAGLAAIKSEVQASIRQWAAAINERNTSMVDDILEHQQQHLSVVEGVLGSTADLIDAIITTSRNHLAREMEEAQLTKQHAVDVANSEMSRLRAQNALLTRLLSDERAKTAKLRSDLISNLTNLVVDFTDAQDASWSGAISGVQAVNQDGIVEMDRYSTSVEARFAESSKMAQEVDGDMELAIRKGNDQRTAGKRVLSEARSGVKSRLEHFGQEAGAEVDRTSNNLNGRMDQLGEVISSVATSAEYRANIESESIAAIASNAQSTHETSLSRTSAMCDDNAVLSSSLLASHAKTSKSFDKYHAISSSTMALITERTAKFLTEEISEDVPTGVTPRKKVWDVPLEWERTEPREALIAAMRRKATTSPDAAQSCSRVEMRIPTEPSLPLYGVRPTRSLSQQSLSDDSENQRIPSPDLTLPSVNGLSQLKPPSKRHDVGKVRKDETGRMAVPILGEGGANIPRRLRK